jgi:hypothetical protein
VHKRISLRAIAIPVALMGLTALMVIAVPSAAMAQGLSPGTFVNRASGKCMTNGGSTANSAPITQYKCNGTYNQDWIWDPNNDADSIFNYQDYTNGINMCLTNGGSTENSTPITQYSCNPANPGSVNQQWYLIAVDGYFVIENINGFCMTSGGSTANSAPITQYACDVGNPSVNQQWTYDGDGFN